jgi:hypothetical protein
MGAHHEYQVITVIPEDDEWEAQELVSPARDKEAAIAMQNAPISGTLPHGTSRYIEVRTHTDWERL